MTIFRSELVIGLLAAALCGFFAWVSVRSMKTGKAKFAGQHYARSRSPTAYRWIVGFEIVAAVFALLLAVQILTSFDVRFWL